MRLPIREWEQVFGEIKDLKKIRRLDLGIGRIEITRFRKHSKKKLQS